MKTALLIPSAEQRGANAVALSHTAILSEKGHDITVLFPRDRRQSGVPADVGVGRLGHTPGLSPWQRPWQLLFDILPPPLHLPFIGPSLPGLQDFETVISYDYSLAWLGHYGSRRYGLRHVHFVEGVRYLPPDASRRERAYCRLLDYWMAKLCAHADLVATESVCAAREIERRYGVACTVTGSVTNLSLFNPGADDRAVRSLYGLGEDPLILYVDRLQPDKDVEGLINAFGLVQESIPGARLMIIGKPYRGSYLKRIKKLTNESVILIDEVPHDALASYYAASTIFATCALVEEGYSHTVVEAQACGKPVVAFRIGPHEEIVKDGETGILVDRVGDSREFAAAMLTLLTDQSRTDAMGRRAASWAAGLSEVGRTGIQGLCDRIADS
ncbi:MAG: glycosyltransferase family 4 protein [Dehalococcoidia bacterium]